MKLKVATLSFLVLLILIYGRAFSQSEEDSCSCINRCGDGICQNKGCGRCGFTCCEDKENCPNDCFKDKKKIDDYISRIREGQRKARQKEMATEELEKDAQQEKLTIQRGKGLVTKCSYRAGAEVCGVCYCLKPVKASTILFNQRRLRGCARLDISIVGDLSRFVGKVVDYEGTSEFDATFICPQHFRLFTIKLIEEEN